MPPLCRLLLTKISRFFTWDPLRVLSKIFLYAALHGMICLPKRETIGPEGGMPDQKDQAERFCQPREKMGEQGAFVVKEFLCISVKPGGILVGNFA